MDNTKNMSCSTINITILSAENLRLEGKPIKKNAFVIVKTDPCDTKSTNADFQGGCNPSWNQKLVVNMPTQAPFIALEVRCRTSSSDKIIGLASIPVSDFLGDYTPPNCLHFLSYRLRDARGERNGIINVSVKMDVPVYYPCSTAARKNVENYACSPRQRNSPMWRPVPAGLPVVTGERSRYDGVVIGVPAW